MRKLNGDILSRESPKVYRTKHPTISKLNAEIN